MNTLKEERATIIKMNDIVASNWDLDNDNGLELLDCAVSLLNEIDDLRATLQSAVYELRSIVNIYGLERIKCFLENVERDTGIK